jgi:uncharacterized protein (TIGR03086 family)
MSTAPLEQAIASTRTVLAGVKADQLDADTPCASWKVRDLVNHIVGGQYFFVAMVEGAPPSDAGDFSTGDFVAAFDEGSATCVAAFKGDGVMEKILTLPFGQMPGSAFVGIAATDTFTHGWDLAKATGQSTDLAPELAGGLLAGAKQFISDGIRGPEPMPFAAEQAAPAGASTADQLAAFLGRSV